MDATVELDVKDEAGLTAKDRAQVAAFGIVFDCELAQLARINRLPTADDRRQAFVNALCQTADHVFDEVGTFALFRPVAKMYCKWQERKETVRAEAFLSAYALVKDTACPPKAKALIDRWHRTVSRWMAGRLSVKS